MNLKEAYSVLGISQSASPEEAKKKYRDLTKKYHPDINKDPGAEDKFKKINEAYECVKSGKGNDPIMMSSDFNGSPFGFGGGFSRGFSPDAAQPIHLDVAISFKESVIGCKKDIKFNRTSRCADCGGKGARQIDNGCTECGGRGQTVENRGTSIFIKTCNKCHGRVNVEPCTICHDGSVNTDVSIKVTIPGGISNNSTLRLQGMGHYIGDGLFGTQNGDAFLTVHVEDNDKLRVDGPSVVCDLSITLLEALNGCTKKVPTINGDKEIIIKPMSRNKEEVIIPRLGVNSIGNQRVILDVKYPNNIDKLIEALKEGEV